MKIKYGCVLLLLAGLTFAQQFQIKQDDDAILFFNESKQTVEVWLRIQQLAVNEVVVPGEMKKFVHPEYLKPEDLTDSEVFYAYSYKALEKDVERSLNQFFTEIENKRSILNRGYEKVNLPFYRTERFQVFLDNPDETERWKSLNSNGLNAFIQELIIPESRDLMISAHKDAPKSRQNVTALMNRFLSNNVVDESEYPLFVNQMNQLETFFAAYSDLNNVKKDLGSLQDNGFEVFTGNPGTDIGVYMTTNNLKLVRDYNYREMDTRGFNFEVYAAQRFAKTRVGKRRTVNYYGAASYLSLKDKEYGLKKSFINLGPEVRYTGYYENQVQWVLGAGITADITAEKYIAPEDKKQFGFYAGTEISLLFIRLGIRYYSNLAEKDLMPEGNLFYRGGIVAKF